MPPGYNQVVSYRATEMVEVSIYSVYIRLLSITFQRKSAAFLQTLGPGHKAERARKR